MALGSVGSMAVALLGDMRDFDRKMDGATKRVNKFSSSVKKMGTAVTKYAKMAALAATAAVVAFGVSAVKTFVDFDTGMREVFTLMPELSEMAREQMTEDVQTLAKEIAILPTKVIPALYQAISAGVPKENVFTFMEIAGKAAIGGVTELEVAVDGLTTATNAYGLEVLTAQEAADIMFTAVKFGKTTFEELSARMFQAVPVAAKIGLEFKNVAAAAAQITLAGVPMRVAMTQIRSLLNEVAFEGKELNRVFVEAAGMSFPQYIEAGGDIAGIIEILEGAAEDAGISVAELTANLEAQGAMLNLSGIALDGLRNILEEMTDSTGAAEAAYEEMAAGVQFQLNQLKVWWQNLKLDIGGDLTENLKDLLTWLEENREAIGDKIKAIFDGLIAGLEWMTDNADLVKASLITIAAGFTALWVTANPAAAAVLAVVGALAWFESEGGVAGAYDELQNLAQGFRDLITEEEEAAAVTQAVAKALLTTLNTAGSSLQDFLDRARDSGRDIEGVWAEIVTAQREAIEELEAGERFDEVLNNFSMMVTGVLDEYGLLDDEIAAILTTILSDSASMWSQMTGIVVKSTTRTTEAVIGSVGIIAEALEDEREAVVETGRVIAEALEDKREAIAETTEDVIEHAEVWGAEYKNIISSALADTLWNLGTFHRDSEASYEENQAAILAIIDTGFKNMANAILKSALDKAIDKTIDWLWNMAFEAEAAAVATNTALATVGTGLSLSPLALAAVPIAIGTSSAVAGWVADANAWLEQLFGAFGLGSGANRGSVRVPAYGEGGVVPGPIGAPQMAIVHGGEEILPPEERVGEIDYERMSVAVYAGTYDALKELEGEARPTGTADNFMTRLAQSLYPALQVESERRGGDGW